MPGENAIRHEGIDMTILAHSVYLAQAKAVVSDDLPPGSSVLLHCWSTFPTPESSRPPTWPTTFPRNGDRVRPYRHRRHQRVVRAVDRIAGRRRRRLRRGPSLPGRIVG